MSGNRAFAAIEILAAAIFGGAVGYATHAFLALPYSAAFGVIGFLSGGLLLRRTADTPHFILPDFAMPDFDEHSDELLLTEEVKDELVLTEQCRVLQPVESESLILDDILAEIGPESRVVRLFDRKAMPTPGQMRSRIDSHLDHRRSPPVEDASQALSDALAELRRSLR